MRTTPDGRGRPRTTLDALRREWKTANRARRKDIQKNWHRSIRSFHQALLADYPDGLPTPTIINAMSAKYWREANESILRRFDTDAFPTAMVDGQPIPFEAVLNSIFEAYLRAGWFDYTKGINFVTNTDFPAFLRIQLSCWSYQDAWKQRRIEGHAGGRAETPLIGDWHPNDAWTAEDHNLRFWEEARCKTTVKKNAAAMAAAGLTYEPVTLEELHKATKKATAHGSSQPLEDLPPSEVPPAAPPLPAFTGPNGRPMHVQIVQDAEGMLYKRFVEMTQQEHEADLRSREFTIFASPYATLGISPRESWRPLYEAAGRGDELEEFSDEIIEYYVDEEYGRQAAAQETARAAAEAAAASGQPDST